MRPETQGYGGTIGPGFYSPKSFGGFVPGYAVTSAVPFVTSDTVYTIGSGTVSVSARMAD